jgi:transcriptional regulator with XRE-family HTH domain
LSVPFDRKEGISVTYDIIGNGLRLLDLRGKRTREEVAAATGTSVSALAMYELGQRNPRDEVKCALAEYYAVPVSSIFFPEKYTKSVQNKGR